jgi:hypothetical protein
MYDDQFALFRKALNGGAPPEFVKTAQLLTVSEREQLPDHCFALIMQEQGETLRKFACVDAAHVAVSAVYLDKLASTLPKEAVSKAANNLCLACRRFSMEVPERLRKLAAERRTVIHADNAPFLEKAAAEVSGQWDPYVTTTERWPVARMEKTGASVHIRGAECPVNTLGQVKTAAARFEAAQRVLHPRDKRQLAVTLRTKLAEFGVEPEPESSVAALSGDALRPDDELVRALTQRAELWSPEEAGPASAMAVELLEQKDSLSPDELAEALATLDISTGLDQYWGSKLTSPWEALLNEYHAPEETTWDVDGAPVTAGDLAAIVAANGEQISATLGPDVLDGLTSDPETVFPSLPLDVKKAIVALR